MKSGELKWPGFLTVAFGVFMATLDFSAVVVAMPRIAREFNAVMTDVEWVVVAYVLTSAALVLPLGRCGDQYGKHRIFKIGVSLFVLSSLLCALSNTVYQLIGFRILQGIGSAIYISVSPAVLVDAFPRTQRGKVVGFMGTVVSLGLMLGAPIGGLLTHYISWRAIFMINLPVGIAGMIWNHFYLPKDELEEQRFEFDFLGALLSIIASATFLMSLSRLSVWGIRSPYLWGLFSIFIFCAICFFYVEKKNPYGVLDLKLFKSKFFSFSMVVLVLYFISINVVYFLCPFYLAEVLNYSQRKVGFVMMAVPCAFAILNPISGWLSDYVGTRLLVPLGLFVGTIAYGGISLLTEASSELRVILSLLCVGVSSGLFQAPNSSGIMGSVARARLGMASSLLPTMRNFGTVIGVALATTIFTFRVEAYNGFGTEFSIHKLPNPLFMEAFRDTLLIAAAIAFLAMIAAMLRGPDPQAPQ